MIRLSLGRETLDSIQGLAIYPLNVGLSRLANTLEQACTQALINQESVVIRESDIAKLVAEHVPIAEAKKQVALQEILSDCCEELAISNYFEIEELV